MKTQTLTKIADLNLSKNHYDATAGVVVWCFDDRFTPALERLKTLYPGASDIIKIAGGVKSLSSPDNVSDRDFILDQIGASIRLHNAARIFLMAHNQCGACGGAEDVDFYLQELEKGEKAVKDRFGDQKEIVKIFVDFNGMYQV